MIISDLGGREQTGCFLLQYDGVETLISWQCEEKRDRKELEEDIVLKVTLPVTLCL